jgi:hypothetical protein
MAVLTNQRYPTVPAQWNTTLFADAMEKPMAIPVMPKERV